MVTVKKVGVDAGNNGGKFFLADIKPYMIPSVYSEYMGESMALMDQEDVSVEKLLENLDITINSKSITFSGTRYIVGQKVLEDSLVPIEMETKSNKAKDDLPIILSLSGLVVEAIQSNPTSDKIRVHYDLSVALPITTINPTVAKEYEERYIGTHLVTFHHPSGRNVEIEIVIEFCKCLPEGAAASWGVVYNEKGELIERTVEVPNGNGEEAKVTFEDETILHFDIGAGTTEIVVTHGVAFKPKLSQGLSFGTKETIHDLITKWNNANPRKSIDSISEFNKIFFDKEHPRHNALIAHSTNFARLLAQKLSTPLINKINELKDVPYIFVYGGGADFVKEPLTMILQAKGYSSNVIFVNDPMFVNSRGLFVYTSSPRYDELKKKSLA